MLPPQLSTVPIVSSTFEATGEMFPVRRIYCVGRNYWAHAVEMEDRAKKIGIDGDPREPPFFFQKSSFDTLVVDGRVPYPPMTQQLEFEVELIVALVGQGRNVAVEDAPSLVGYYGVGCDLTRRDLQTNAKTLRRPWDTAKSFDFSAPCSALTDVKPPDNARLRLTKNGILQQETTLDLMIFSVDECIAALSKEVTLQPGDIIFSGTPAGVSTLLPGDDVLCSVVAPDSESNLLPPCRFSIGE